MVCKNCGSVVEDKAKFCENCGTKIEEEVKAEEVAANEANEEPAIERVEGEEIKPEHTATAATDSLNDPDFESVNIEKADKGNKGFAIASMVCGIVSIVCCCCSPLGICCSIAAIVTGIIAIKNDYEGRGMAIAGIVCGGVGALFFISSIIASVSNIGKSNFNFDFNSLDDFIESL